jgi:TRAP-type C4-dicarboxylate transport system permease small subunit
LTKTIRFLERIDKVLRKALVAVAALLLLAMLGLTVANIIMRKFGTPISGTFELTGLFGAIVAAGVLGYTQRRKENIAVDILFNYFPKTLKRIIRIFSDLVCAAFSILAAWEIAKIGIKQLTTGEVTETLRIIPYPFVFVTAAGFAALGFVFFIDMIANILSKGEKHQ